MDLAKLKKCEENYLSAMWGYRQELEKVFDETVKEGDFIEFTDCPAIAYDGGNDYEFASTLCSFCSGVGKKNNQLYFCLEDDSEYHISRMSTDDLAAVFDYCHTDLGV